MIELLREAQGYEFTSLRYADLDELQMLSKDDLIIHKADVIFVCHKVNNDCHILWAAKSQEAFYESIDELKDKLEAILANKPRRLYMEFVEPQFIPCLEDMGFRIVSQFVDFWNDDLVCPEPSARESTVTIRHPLIGEYADVSLITKLCAEQSRGFYGEDAAFIHEWMEQDNSCILLAEADGRPVGVCLLNIYGFESEKGPVLWIRQLAVNPKYQNLGIGTRLMEESMRWGKSHGAKRSFLAVDKLNSNAIHVYNKLGFKCTNEIGQINMALYTADVSFSTK